MKFNFKNNLIIFVFLAVFLFSANNAEACSCITLSLGGAIDSSSNIVIVKLQTVEKYGENEKGYGLDGVKQSRLTVEKSFKGNLKVGRELIFAQGGGADCVWTFYENRIGTEYLLFLDSKPDQSNLWRAYACSRSNSVQGAAEDLLYLNKMSKVAGKTRLSGTLVQRDESAVEGQKTTYKPLPGRLVKIRGNGKDISLKTDENGVYEIYELPFGKYNIRPEKVAGYKIDENNETSVEVEIKENELTEQGFEYNIDNSIAGKLFDTNGQPISNAYVRLIPAKGKKLQLFIKGEETDEDGGFKIEEIPAGTYVLVMNEENVINAAEPFGALYYPNKPGRKEAAEITIGAGDHFKDFIMTAPPAAETIEVSGILLFEDGKPAAGEYVEFFNNVEAPEKIENLYHWDSTAKTDQDGKFKIKILKGQKGILFGKISTYIGQYQNCPKLDSLVKATGEKFADLETTSVQITADDNASEIKLDFPFPGCEKVSLTRKK